MSDIEEYNPPWYWHLSIVVVTFGAAVMFFHSKNEEYVADKATTQQILRESYSRMSTDPEIQEAYRAYDKEQEND